jgi:hypothetical protein
MQANVRPINWPLGIIGTLAGGVLGYFAFFWMARQGFYALVLPGAALGLGCGFFSRGKSWGLGIVCGIFGVMLAVIAEWQRAPFIADDSFRYFLIHVGALKPFTLVSIGLSGLLAYWFGRGRTHMIPERNRKARPEECD